MGEFFSFPYNIWAGPEDCSDDMVYAAEVSDEEYVLLQRLAVITDSEETELPRFLKENRELVFGLESRVLREIEGVIAENIAANEENEDDDEEDEPVICSFSDEDEGDEDEDRWAEAETVKPQEYPPEIRIHWPWIIEQQ